MRTEEEKEEQCLIDNLMLLWAKDIAKEQGDCKNIDYTKPRTKEIYHQIMEMDRTLKDVVFSISYSMGKTKPLGETGYPRSWKNAQKKEDKYFEHLLNKSLESEDKDD